MGKPTPLDAVFVQSADAMTSGPSTVTLQGLSSSTIYFADDPRREVGHLPTSGFVELWGAEDAFAVDSPSAVISFVDDDEALGDVFVVVREPRLEDGALTYSVDVLEGTLPAIAGPCALFIDASGRLFSRISVGAAASVDA